MANCRVNAPARRPGRMNRELVKRLRMKNDWAIYYQTLARICGWPQRGETARESAEPAAVPHRGVFFSEKATPIDCAQLCARLTFFRRRSTATRSRVFTRASECEWTHLLHDARASATFASGLRARARAMEPLALAPVHGSLAGCARLWRPLTAAV
jgi:hypothetical protein